MLMLIATVLSYPTLTLNDEPIEIGRRKALALFVYLLLERREHSRDYLCTLLWSDLDQAASRAELRRMLATLNQTALAPYLIANRQTISLNQELPVQVDWWQLDTLLESETDPVDVLERLESATHPFLEGFSLPDAPAFDVWQIQTANMIQGRLLRALDRLTLSSLQSQKLDLSLRFLHIWLAIDPLNENVHRQLMLCFARNDQRSAALQHYQQLLSLLQQEMGTSPEAETVELATRLGKNEPLEDTLRAFVGGHLPPLPFMLVGRDEVVSELRTRLGIGRAYQRRQVIMQGWPGIGKTTLTSALAHDAAVQHHFRDGVLWLSLGQAPDLFASLRGWATALNIPIDSSQDIRSASMTLANAARDKKLLLIVDDIWDEAHLSPFKIGGNNSALLITTRLNRVAQAIATSTSDIYKVPILSDENAVDLLRALAPSALEEHPDEMRNLVHDLEGLPLALQVAGRLLRIEQSLGWGVKDLLSELREGSRLLSARAPADRQLSDDDAPLTVAALLKLSTDSLDDDMQERFALLGVFAPKPAMFDLDAMQAVWMLDDGRPTVRQLVERGLLEAIPPGQFQMHALLVQHARSMFSDETPQIAE